MELITTSIQVVQATAIAERAFLRGLLRELLFVESANTRGTPTSKHGTVNFSFLNTRLENDTSVHGIDKR
jgi:hypothetical protein